MLFEALRHFFLKIPRDIKDLGFGKEALAIQSRYKRCRPHWKSHLENTKNELLTIAEKYGKNKKIVILGSGNLLDVPFEELAKISNSLTLVDIIQLPETLNKVKNLTNVSLIEKDLTEFVTPFNTWAKNKSPDSFPNPQVPDFQQLNADLIISLNLISQLVIPFNEYFEKNNLEIPLPNLEEKLINNHISALKKSGGKAFIIGDISRSYMEGGKILKKDYLPENLSLPEPINFWNWDIAPRGEADLKISIRHKVGVWDLSNP